MEKLAQLHRKIAPEFISIVEDRYEILRHIQHAGPVGRRALATTLGMGERVVRAQVDFLKEVGLVEFSMLGMTITEQGRGVLSGLAEYIRLLHSMDSLEYELAEKLGLKRVVIIPGDSEADSAVKSELGRAAARLLGEYLNYDMTVAVSGGSTMAVVAESVTIHAPATTVVPARGGLGEQVENQANTIAAVMAGKLGGRYRLLHIPDGLSEEALEVIQASDSNVRSVAGMIRKADILMHGVGQAAEMAKRRSHEEFIVNDIINWGAVGEALGQYYALNGQVIYSTSSVGLRLDDLNGVGTVIAVAGGNSKAEAIVAVANAGGQDILVTDESAARAIQIIINRQMSNNNI